MSAVCVLLTVYSGEEQNKNLLTPSLGRFQPTRIILALFAENMHSRGNKRIMTFNSGSLQSHVCWIFHIADVNFSRFCLRKLKAVKFVDYMKGDTWEHDKKNQKTCVSSFFIPTWSPLTCTRVCKTSAQIQQFNYRRVFLVVLCLQCSRLILRRTVMAHWFRR